MPLDLTGIQNVGEFYSHHYLDALLEGDLKGLLKKWDAVEQPDGSQRTPDRALGTLARTFFDTRARVRRSVAAEARFEEGHAWHVTLLEALGYELAPRTVELPKNDWLVPLLTSLRRDGQEHLWVLEVPFPDQRPAVAPGQADTEDTSGDAATEAADSLWTQHLIPAQLHLAPLTAVVVLV